MAAPILPSPVGLAAIRYSGTMSGERFTVLGRARKHRVRGTETLRYGGNTSSLEVRCGERLLLFDAGTGIRYLGNRLPGSTDRRDLYLTHTHFDHVCGLPFFRPLFQQENTFRVWAGHLGGRASIQQVLWKFMMAPLFPVPPEVFRAT